jgi:hypothetical protein
MPPPVVPGLVAPEFDVPAPVSPWATRRHAPKDEFAVATEARAAALTETAGGSAGS